MTTTPQAALLREAAQNALITLDGIADTNPRDTADFETPAEWIAWAKSRARWAADALRAPIAQEIYAERILRKMLHESDQSQATHQCGTCGHIGIEDPVKGCPKCGFDDMRAINSRDTQEPVQAGELPPLPSSAHWEERIKTLMQQTPLPNSMSVYQAFKQFQNEFEHATVEYARAALSARKPLPYDLICNAIDLADTESMKGDYMLDSGDCIAVVRTMQALIEINGIGLEVKP